MIWLTCSQQYGMMKKVRETLASRRGILELYSLSQREKTGLYLTRNLNFPFQLCKQGDAVFLKTTLKKSLTTFGKAVCRRYGALTMSFAESISTLILEGLHIVYLLQPYSNNAFKRLTKTPKLYFCDTGLCAYLSMWLTLDILRQIRKEAVCFL